MPQQPRSTLQLCVSPKLTEAVRLAASREMTTTSEFVRRVLIARLRAEGIDPATATAQDASRISRHRGPTYKPRDIDKGTPHVAAGGRGGLSPSEAPRGEFQPS
jgi:hypothetical protein